MDVKVGNNVFNTLVAIMKSGIFTKSEMRDTETVIWYLNTIKMTEVADWIKNNKVLYLTGLLTGFSIDNSQKEQLKQIHTNKAEDILHK